MTPSNETMNGTMEIGLHGRHVKVVIWPADIEEEEAGANDLGAELANEKLRECCQGKMPRSEDHEIEFRLDYIELRFRPKWIKKIRPQTLVKEVKHYI